MSRQPKVSDDPFELLADDYFFDIPVARIEKTSFQEIDDDLADDEAHVEKGKSQDFLSVPDGKDFSSDVRSGGQASGKSQEAEQAKDLPAQGTINGGHRSSSQVSPRGRWDLRSIFFATVTGGGLFGILIFGLVWLTPSSDQVDQFAYLEMRAIGPQGRPIAGASVKQGETLMGYTDSFGEWRRYLKVNLGQTLVFTLLKKSSDGVLQATKNIAIPAQMPKSGELEIKTQIGLLRQSFENEPVLRAQNSLPEKNAVAHTSTTGGGASSFVSSPPQKVVGGDDGQSEPKTSGAQGTIATTVRNGEGELPGSGAEKPILLKNQLQKPEIWVAQLNDPKRQDGEHLSAPLIPLLRESFAQGGFRVHPDAQVTLLVGALRHLDTWLVHVKASFKNASDGRSTGQNQILFSFLRAAQTDPKVASEDILRALSRHGLILPWLQGQALCQGLIPCSIWSPSLSHIPPQMQWQKMSLKSTVPLSEHVEVYISGFLAKPVGGQTYEYWGPPTGPANVTIVQGGEVLYREKIVPSVQKTLVLPAALYARIGRGKTTADGASKM